MTNSDHLFWDSCCFIRYLSGVPSAHVGESYVGDLDDYIQDAKKRDRAIYYSTMIFAEIRPRYLIKKFGNIRQFMNDLKGAFYPVEPNPNILIAAGELKDARTTNPGDPKAKLSREIGTPDAIHLMSCVYARDVLKIPNLVFHTLDQGKGPSWEGRCVPLLGFEKWFPPGKRTARVQEVCDLPRELPIYPQSNLLRYKPNAEHQPNPIPGK